MAPELGFAPRLSDVQGVVDYYCRLRYEMATVRGFAPRLVLIQSQGDYYCRDRNKMVGNEGNAPSSCRCKRPALLLS